MPSYFRRAVALVAVALVAPALALTSESFQASSSAAVRQSGYTALLPQIVQNGATVAAADAAKLTGSIRFRPIRKGRPVIIQRRIGAGAWQKVATKRQNGAGAVSFTGAARKNGKFYTYRGVAVRWNGLARFAARPQNAGVWKRKFSDEFGGTSLSAKWSYRYLDVYSAKSDRTCSRSTKDAVKVGGGRVSLLVKADGSKPADCVALNPRTNEPYTNRHWYKNGHISTSEFDAGAFRYGIAAARVRFDRPQGAHGSFWLQSVRPDVDGQGPGQDGAEIDVVEYFGKEFRQGDVYQFIHYRDAADRDHKVPDGTPITAARKALKRDDDWFKRYHVFSVQWTPNAYIFRVDGIQTLKLTQGVSRVPEYMILSMLSSGWELEKMQRSTLPNATQVDWVRFWQK